MKAATTILIVDFARGRWQRGEVSSWLAEVRTAAGTVPGLAPIQHGSMDQEPTTAARNKAASVARQLSANILFMVDNDMAPSVPFFYSAIEFLRTHRGAVCIGSPYCGAPPLELVQVRDKIGGDVQRGNRDDAARADGIKLVREIGTGLIAFNMACFDSLDHPYFRYTYTSPEETDVDETEDFNITRRLTEKGGRVYIDWNSWSGHAKNKIVGKPEPPVVASRLQ